MNWTVPCCTNNCPHLFDFEQAPWGNPTVVCPTCGTKQHIAPDEDADCNYWFISEKVE